LRKQIQEILQADSQKPEQFEKLLKQLEEKDSGFSYLLEKFQIEKKKILAKSWPSWFSRLGWWFAKLLMYGALLAAIVAIGLFGKKAVDPLTYGLVGAAAYYVIIQLFTPGRINREIAFLDVEDEKQSLQKLFAQINEEKTD